MRDLLDHQLQRLARRRRLHRAAAQVLPALALSLGVVATLVMVVRLALPTAAWMIPALAAAGVLIPWLRWPRAWRVDDQAYALAGHLDHLVDGRGLAMALAEQSSEQRDDAWAARLRQSLETLRLPTFDWSLMRGPLIAALLVIIAWALPQQQPHVSRVDPIAALFASTAAQIDALDTIEALPPERIAEHRKRLLELHEHAAREGMDQATWEAKDRLAERLRTEAAASSRALAEALAQAEVLTRSDATANQEAAAALAQRLGDLAARAPGMVPTLKPGDAEAFRNAVAAAQAKGLLSPEQADALERLGFRPQAGGQAQLNEQQRRQLADEIRQQLEDRARELGTCQGGEDFGNDLERARQGGPGQGDPTRGPGHTDHPQLATDRFAVGNLDDLPPGARVNADGSITLAEQVRDPELDDAANATAVRAAARAFDPTAADARRATLAPRHRAAVGRYFATEVPADTAPNITP